MKTNKNYTSIITIIASSCFSLFFIAKSFILHRDQGGIRTALPLAIPALVLLIPISITLVIMILKEVKYRKILASGIKSVGFINKVTETGNYIKKQPEVKLEIDVLEENGNKFSGEIITVVHFAELELLKEGESVPVIYNSNSKKEISIDIRPDIEKLRDKIDHYKAQSNVS